MDDGGSEAGSDSKPCRKPCLATGGSFTLKDPADVFDDNSLEGQIARLEKRLRKNLPHDARAKLELELENLQDQKAMADAGAEQASQNRKEDKAPARRKPGSAAMQGPDEVVEAPKQEKKTKRVNRAAPKVQHPQTMARMQDWRKELDRRIKEQEAIDAKNAPPQGQEAWFNLSAWVGDSPEKEQAKRRSGGSTAAAEGNPLAALQGAASAVVEALAGALGLQEPEPSPEPLPQARPLPKQTFSRRL